MSTDLEFGYSGQAAASGSDQHQQAAGRPVIHIEPHPEICEKKKEVLHQIALEKIAVREAKGDSMFFFRLKWKKHLLKVKYQIKLHQMPFNLESHKQVFVAINKYQVFLSLTLKPSWSIIYYNSTCISSTFELYPCFLVRTANPVSLYVVLAKSFTFPCYLWKNFLLLNTIWYFENKSIAFFSWNYNFILISVWVQVFLLFVLCLCVLVYLQSEG